MRRATSSVPTRSSSPAAAPTAPSGSSRSSGVAPDRIGAVVAAGVGLGGTVLATSERVVWDGDGGHVGLGLPIRLDDATQRRPDGHPRARRRPFTELELRIADLLVTQIEVALHNADLHARVSEAAVRDPLTGLLNRRYFDEAVETAFASAARSGRDLSLIVLDLDRFCEVNNVHGHAVGDAVLRRVARAMAEAVRTGDIVARYGGEEFVVIAPGADRDAAVALAERIRAAVDGRSRPADRRARHPAHDLGRRRVTPRRRGRRPGALPRRRLGPARRQARRPRPGRRRLAELRRCVHRGHAERLVDDGVALLAQELRDVVHRQPGLAGRAAALPAAERLDARPRAGRRAGPPVDVEHARLDPVEELLDLGRVLAVDAGRQPVDRVVGERQRLVERIDRVRPR